MDAMSCLAQPPPAQFLAASSSPAAAYYADAAIARALHFASMPQYEYDYDYAPAAAAAAASSPSSASAASSSSFFADFPCDVGGGGGSSSSWFASAPAPATGPFVCDSVLVASDVAAPRPPSTPVAARRPRAGLGPNAAGRPGKRRARASKRAPTTYISTDPANFRLMVQHVTGVQAEPAADGSALHATFDASSSAAAALLGGHTFDGAFGDAPRLPSDVDAAALHRHHQQQVQQPCFPTLDSWSVMYESSQQQ